MAVDINHKCIKICEIITVTTNLEQVITIWEVPSFLHLPKNIVSIICINGFDEVTVNVYVALAAVKRLGEAPGNTASRESNPGGCTWLTASVGPSSCSAVSTGEAR